MSRTPSAINLQRGHGTSLDKRCHWYLKKKQIELAMKLTQPTATRQHVLGDAE